MVTSADVTDNESTGQLPLPDFDDELFIPPKVSQVKLSRSQKHVERQQNSLIVTGPDLQIQGTDKLCRAQQEDPTLTDICQQARQTEGGFLIKDNLVYRLVKKGKQQEECGQLVLQNTCVGDSSSNSNSWSHGQKKDIISNTTTFLLARCLQ